MGNDTSITPYKVPKLDELIKAGESQISLRGKESNLMVLLNQDPPSQWIKKHKTIKKNVIVNGVIQSVPYEYLPIARVEFLLKAIFINYRIEVLKTATMFNSVECTVRVHYQNPITNEWSFHDGVGAQWLQTDAGTKGVLMDGSNVKQAGVQMALPIAKSLAIKDACDHFGKLFGSDLSRDTNNEMSYENYIVPIESIQDINNRKERERVALHIQNCNDISELEGMRANCEKHNLTNELNDKLLILYANQD